MRDGSSLHLLLGECEHVECIHQPAVQSISTDSLRIEQFGHVIVLRSKDRK